MVLEDGNGILLGARIAADGQWRFPHTDSVPENFRQAIVEFEDRRFYSHFGFDLIANLHADARSERPSSHSICPK